MRARDLWKLSLSVGQLIMIVLAVRVLLSLLTLTGLAISELSKSESELLLYQQFKHLN